MKNPNDIRNEDIKENFLTKTRR